MKPISQHRNKRSTGNKNHFIYIIPYFLILLNSCPYKPSTSCNSKHNQRHCQYTFKTYFCSCISKILQFFKPFYILPPPFHWFFHKLKNISLKRSILNNRKQNDSDISPYPEILIFFHIINFSFCFSSVFLNFQLRPFLFVTGFGFCLLHLFLCFFLFLLCFIYCFNR